MRGALGSEAVSDGASADEEREWPDEGRFDHYEVVRNADGAFEKLGRGAMGITYRAVDTVLGCAVALKVIDARVAARPEARERFLREARAAARLRSPPTWHRSFTTGYAEGTTNVSTPWSWSRARAWRAACAGRGLCRR